MQDVAELVAFFDLLQIELLDVVVIDGDDFDVSVGWGVTSRGVVHPGCGFQFYMSSGMGPNHFS